MIKATTTIKGRTANVLLESSTPNLKEYQIKETLSGNWKTVNPKIQLKLTQKHQEWRFRAVNTANVCGPEYRLIIERRD